MKNENKYYVYYAEDSDQLYALSIPPCKYGKSGGRLRMVYKISDFSFPETVLSESTYYIGEL